MDSRRAWYGETGAPLTPTDASGACAQVSQLLAACGSTWPVKRHRLGHKRGHRIRNLLLLISGRTDVLDAALCLLVSILRAEFGILMEKVQRELQRMACTHLQEIQPDRQQIISSRSFGKIVTEFTSNSKLMQAVDTLIQQFGRGAVKVSIQGAYTDWQMLQERKSPSYTTDWGAVSTV